MPIGTAVEGRMSHADGTSDRVLDQRLQSTITPHAVTGERGSRHMESFGPNQVAVEGLITRAGRLDRAEALALFEARVAWFELRADSSVERAALQVALRSASRSGRLQAYQRARQQAASAFREARRGEVGPWLSVAFAVSNAAGALVVADLLDQRHFHLLYGPWRQAIGDRRLVALGPGTGTGTAAATVRRHRAGTAS